MRTQSTRTATTRKSLSSSRSPMGMLLMISLFLLSITGAFWAANDTGFTINSALYGKGRENMLSDEQRNALNARHINRKFVMGGIYLGMSQQAVLDILPDAQVGVDRMGEPIITVQTPDGVLVAWLYSNDNYIEVGGNVVQDKTRRVYRLRLDEGFSRLSEQDILARYAREYGRPIEANCSRSGLGDAPRCTYRWWGGDGIALEASAKKKVTVDGINYTQLTTTATSTIKSPKVSVVRLSNVSVERRWGNSN